MNCPACKQEVADTGLGTPLTHRLQGSQEFCPGFVGEVPKYIAPGVMPVPEDFTPPGRKVRSDKGTKRHPRTKGGNAHVPDRYAGDSAAPGGPPSQEPERVAAKLDPPPRFDAVYYKALKRMNTEEGLDVTIVGKDDPTASPFIKAPAPSTPNAEARHDIRPPTLVRDWFNSVPPGPMESTGNIKPRQEPERVATKPQRKLPRAPPVYLVLPGAPPSYADYAEACFKAEEQAEQNPGTSPYLVWEARPVDSFEQGVQRTRLGRVRKTKQ